MHKVWSPSDVLRRLRALTLEIFAYVAHIAESLQSKAQNHIVVSYMCTSTFMTYAQSLISISVTKMWLEGLTFAIFQTWALAYIWWEWIFSNMCTSIYLMHKFFLSPSNIIRQLWGLTLVVDACVANVVRNCLGKDLEPHFDLWWGWNFSRMWLSTFLRCAQIFVPIGQQNLPLGFYPSNFCI